MEDLYSIHPGIPRSEECTALRSLKSPRPDSNHGHPHDAAVLTSVHRRERVPPHEPHSRTAASSSVSDLSDLIKAQIASHHRYPALVSAYIECRKVGAPPEMASLLEEIGRGNYQQAGTVRSEIGTDTELDDFMESYCRVLLRYKEELSKPFDEATSFLSTIEMQLSDLCKGATAAATSTACNSPSGNNSCHRFLQTRRRINP